MPALPLSFRLLAASALLATALTALPADAAWSPATAAVDYTANSQELQKLDRHTEVILTGTASKVSPTGFDLTVGKTIVRVENAPQMTGTGEQVAEGARVTVYGYLGQAPYARRSLEAYSILPAEVAATGAVPSYAPPANVDTPPVLPSGAAQPSPSSPGADLYQRNPHTLQVPPGANY